MTTARLDLRDSAATRQAIAVIRDQAAARLHGAPAGTTSTAAPGTDATREHARHIIAETVKDYADAQAINGAAPPAPGTETEIAKAVWDEMFGLGRLQPILDDPDVETVDINGCDQVWINYADGTKRQGPPIADTDAQLIEMIRRWGAWEGTTPRDFSEAQPTMQLSLHHKYRLAAVMRVTPRPAISIRKHRMLDADLDLLTANATITPLLNDFLTAAVRARKTIVVTGGMAAGKTTLIRALAAAISPGERIATIEHDYELFLHTDPARHEDVLAMQVREPNAEGAGAITMTTCIQDALWMNARRIIVGEVRGEELLAMLAAMNTGGDGSLCTLHANSAAEAFPRMLICAESGGLHIAPESLYRAAGLAIGFIVHLDRRAGHRFVSQVSEVLPPADSREPAVNQVFVPDDHNERAIPATAPQSLPALVAAGFDPGPFTVQAWEQVRPL